MTTIAQKIAAGSVLVSTPPLSYSQSWRYTLDGVSVLVTTADMIEIKRSSLISMSRMAGDKLRYYRTTAAERKERRAEYRKWKAARGIK